MEGYLIIKCFTWYIDVPIVECDHKIIARVVGGVTSILAFFFIVDNHLVMIVFVFVLVTYIGIVLVVQRLYDNVALNVLNG